jgi:hypothetical protein
VNATNIAQVAPGATVVPLQASATRLNSAAPLPVMDTLIPVRAADVLFVSSTTLGVLVAPTALRPKFTGAGVRDTPVELTPPLDPGAMVTTMTIEGDVAGEPTPLLA